MERMCILMKLYLIYRMNRTSQIERHLYAFTKNKNYIKRFKEERDMEIFLIKEESMDKEKYRDLSLKMNDLELQEYEVYTKGLASNLKQKVTILTTWSEVESILVHGENMIIKEFRRYVKGSIYTLKDQYIDALNVLGYTTLYQYFTHSERNPYMDGFEMGLENQMSLKDMFGNIDYDEYRLYMFFFGGTYKLK